MLLSLHQIGRPKMPEDEGKKKDGFLESFKMLLFLEQVMGNLVWGLVETARSQREVKNKRKWGNMTKNRES